jgi:hypothetical protein
VLIADTHAANTVGRCFPGTKQCVIGRKPVNEGRRLGKVAASVGLNADMFVVIVLLFLVCVYVTTDCQ